MSNKSLTFYTCIHNIHFDGTVGLLRSYKNAVYQLVSIIIPYTPQITLWFPLICTNTKCYMVKIPRCRVALCIPTVKCAAILLTTKKKQHFSVGAVFVVLLSLRGRRYRQYHYYTCCMAKDFLEQGLELCKVNCSLLLLILISF